MPGVFLGRTRKRRQGPIRSAWFAHCWFLSLVPGDAHATTIWFGVVAGCFFRLLERRHLLPGASLPRPIAVLLEGRGKGGSGCLPRVYLVPGRNVAARREEGC